MAYISNAPKLKSLFCKVLHRSVYNIVLSKPDRGLTWHGISWINLPFPFSLAFCSTWLHPPRVVVFQILLQRCRSPRYLIGALPAASVKHWTAIITYLHRIPGSNLYRSSIKIKHSKLWYSSLMFDLLTGTLNKLIEFDDVDKTWNKSPYTLVLLLYHVYY